MRWRVSDIAGHGDMFELRAGRDCKRHLLRNSDGYRRMESAVIDGVMHRGKHKTKWDADEFGRTRGGELLGRLIPAPPGLHFYQRQGAPGSMMQWRRRQVLCCLRRAGAKLPLCRRKYAGVTMQSVMDVVTKMQA